MTEIIATVGMVMNDRVTGTKYRIIYISNEKVVVCKMEDTKLILLKYDQELIIQFLAQDGVELYQDESKVFDISSFTDSVRSKYEENRKIMYEIEKEYGPDYMELMGRKKKRYYMRLWKNTIYQNPRYGELSEIIFKAACESIHCLIRKCLYYKIKKKNDIVKNQGNNRSIWNQRG